MYMCMHLNLYRLLQDQFQFVHEVVKEYLQENATYSNFQHREEHWKQTCVWWTNILMNMEHYKINFYSRWSIII